MSGGGGGGFGFGVSQSTAMSDAVPISQGGNAGISFGARDGGISPTLLIVMAAGIAALFLVLRK